MLEHAGCRNDRCSSMLDAGTIDARACWIQEKNTVPCMLEQKTAGLLIRLSLFGFLRNYLDWMFEISWNWSENHS